MSKYLISFPSAAMVVPDGEWEAVGRDAHAVIDQAKVAGVYVFGGGIDEDVPPVTHQDGRHDVVLDVVKIVLQVSGCQSLCGCSSEHCRNPRGKNLLLG